MAFRANNGVDDALTATVEAWCQSTLNRDGIAAARLRDDSYTLSLATGGALTKEQELALFESRDHELTSFRVHDLQVNRSGDSATAFFHGTLRLASGGLQSYDFEVRFARSDGEWRATRSRVLANDVPQRLLKPSRSIDWLRKLVAQIRPSFQRVAYAPYKSDEDFGLPRTVPREPLTDDQELPIPPEDLWLGYNYPAHGAEHVDTMLRLLEESDFRIRPGDHILDFGCGAGRMIRHLRRFANSCEIWGVDLSSEHILWCKRNLTPEFKFATTTKVPHLPFADGSFRLIYCGSVFTHIDDLADAWLLELRRLLTPDGRLYVTIHDNQTVELIETARESNHWLDWVRSRSTYRKFKNNFDVMAIGRDDRAQVFYDRDYFCQMARQSFDVVSVTPEAYFYQTAVVLKGRRRDG